MGMARSRPHSSMGMAMARSASSELTARTCRLRFAYDTVSPIVDSERSGEWSGEVGDSYNHNRGNHCYIIVFIFLLGLHNEATKHSVIISKSIID